MVVIVAIFSSCQRDEALKPAGSRIKASSTSNLVESSCSQTYLSFETKEKLNQYLQVKSNLTDSALMVSEIAQGFQSLSSVFYRICKEESQIATYDTIDNGDPIQHGVIYDQYFSSLQIVNHTDDKGNLSTYILPNVSDLTLTRVLNEDRIVKIENKIYKFYSDCVKIIMDGDCSKLAMLDAIDSSDENQKIVVLREPSNYFQNLSRMNATNSDSWDKSNSQTGGNGIKLIIYSNLWRLNILPDYNSNSTPLRGYLAKARMVPLRKRRGWWYDSYEAYLIWDTEYSGNQVYALWYGNLGLPDLNQANNINLFSPTDGNSFNRLMTASDVPVFFQDNGLSWRDQILVLHPSSNLPNFITHRFRAIMERRGASALSEINL